MVLFLNKKILSIVKVLLLVLLVFIVFKSINAYQGIDVTIKNNTDVAISELKITYEDISKDIDIPSIPAHKELKINIIPSENFSEGAMKIYYINSKGNRQEEYIVGYFEKGYSGEVIAEINSVVENGNLLFKVNNQVGF